MEATHEALTPMVVSRLAAIIRRRIINATAARIEGNVADAVGPYLPNFVLGLEQASVDCGLVAPSDAPSNVEVTERVFDFMGRGGKKSLLPLDIKQINPILSLRSTGGLYAYAIGYSEQQRKVVAFIAQNPQDESLVAVIPHQYLDPTWPKAITGDSRYVSLDIPITDGTLDLFPPEWSLFVLPLTQLHVALASLDEFTRGVGAW